MGPRRAVRRGGHGRRSDRECGDRALRRGRRRSPSATRATARRSPPPCWHRSGSPRSSSTCGPTPEPRSSTSGPSGPDGRAAPTSAGSRVRSTTCSPTGSPTPTTPSKRSRSVVVIVLLVIFFRARPPGTWIGYVIGVLAIGAISPVIGVTPRLVLRGIPATRGGGSQAAAAVVRGGARTVGAVHGHAGHDGHGRAPCGLRDCASTDSVTARTTVTRHDRPSARWVTVDVDPGCRLAGVAGGQGVARHLASAPARLLRLRDGRPPPGRRTALHRLAARDACACPSPTRRVAALVFGPLAATPPLRRPSWSGRAINVASLYAVLVLSLRAVLPGTDRVRLALWALVLLGPSYLLDPVRLTFFFGQVNLVLCALPAGRPDHDDPPRSPHASPGRAGGCGRGDQAGPPGVHPLPVRHPPGARRVDGTGVVRRLLTGGPRPRPGVVVAVLDQVRH